MARISLNTPEELLAQIGQAARDLRLYRNLPQAELAERADIGLRTVQRLETTGRVSAEAVVRVAFALGVEAALEKIFVRPSAASIDEMLAADRRPARRRARRSK